MPSDKPLLALAARRVFSSSTGKMLNLLKPTSTPVRAFYSGKLITPNDSPFVSKIFKKDNDNIRVSIQLRDLVYGHDAYIRKTDMDISYCSKKNKFKLTFPGPTPFLDAKHIGSMLLADQIPYEHNILSTPLEISVDNDHNLHFSKFINCFSGNSKFVDRYRKVVEDYQSRSNCP